MEGREPERCRQWKSPPHATATHRYRRVDAQHLRFSVDSVSFGLRISSSKQDESRMLHIVRSSDPGYLGKNKKMQFHIYIYIYIYIYICLRGPSFPRAAIGAPPPAPPTAAAPPARRLQQRSGGARCGAAATLDEHLSGLAAAPARPQSGLGAGLTLKPPARRSLARRRVAGVPGWVASGRGGCVNR